MIHSEDPKEYIGKSLELLSVFSQVIGPKIKTQVPTALVYKNKEHVETENKSTVSFPIALRKTRYLVYT